MSLSDAFVRQAKHSGRPAGDKHADGHGLFLFVNAAGKYWRMRYRLGGKEKRLALGTYPPVTLAAARKLRESARDLVRDGIDPVRAKQDAKAARLLAAVNTFEAIARELHGIKSSNWSESYSAKWLRGREKALFPSIGQLPVTQIKAPRILDALRKVEKREATDAAHTLRENAGQVFRYAIQTERAEGNPAKDLQGALEPLIVKNMPAVLEPAKVGELIRAIDGYTGQPITKAALQLSALLFQRPGNIRAMKWAWVDLDGAMLTIPAEAMKRRIHDKINGRPHLVPLAPVGGLSRYAQGRRNRPNSLGCGPVSRDRRIR